MIETPVLSLPIAKVHPDQDNPRSNLGDLRELAASITEHGVLEPILVRDHPTRKGQWLIVAGHRRHAAAGKAGQKTIPSMVTELTETEAAILQLVENLQREDLAPVDEARAFQRLLDLGLKQVDIARRVSRTKSHISKRLTLLELPKPALDLVGKGTLRLDDAYQLATTLKIDGVDREGLLEAVVENAEPSVRVGDIGMEIKRAADHAAYERDRRNFEADLIALGAIPIADDEVTKRRAARVDRWGLQVDADQHQAEPCSRFDVTFGWAGNKRIFSPRWYCIEPDRHQPAGASQLKVAAGHETTPHEAEQSKAERARMRAKEKRLDQAAQAMIAAQHPELIYHQTARLLIETMNSVELTTANDLLNGTPFRKLHRPLNKSASHATRKDALLDVFLLDPDRVALAVAVAVAESREYTWRETKTDFRYQFLDLLGSHGQTTIDLANETAQGEQLEAVPA